MKSELKAQFQCRCLREGCRPWVHVYRWIFRRILWFDSKDSKYRNFKSTSSLHLLHFRLEDKIQKSSDYLFWFSIGHYVMDQRSGDGRFFGRVEILAISLWQGFSKFRDAGREDCFCSEQDHPEFPVQEEGQPRGTESSKKRIGFYETDRFHDLRLLASDWHSWYSIWLCWFLLCNSSWWQHSGIRYKMGRNFIVKDEDSIWWHSGKSVQIETTWVWSTQNRIRIVPHGNSSENIDAQSSEIEDHGETEHRKSHPCACSEKTAERTTTASPTVSAVWQTSAVTPKGHPAGHRSVATSCKDGRQRPHTHVSHNWLYHLFACAGSVLAPHDIVVKVKRSWTRSFIMVKLAALPKPHEATTRVSTQCLEVWNSQIQESPQNLECSTTVTRKNFFKKKHLAGDKRDWINLQKEHCCSEMRHVNRWVQKYFRHFLWAMVG